MDEGNIKLLNRYEMLIKNKGLTKRSIEAFIGDLTLFLKFIDDKQLQNITHIDVEDFLDYCSTKRNNSPCALARKFTTLNSFFKTMIKKEYLDVKNPLDKLDKIKVRKKVREHLTEDEMNMIFNYLEEEQDLRGLALFSLFFSSGCRLSEIYQLNKDDLDFERRQFKVLGKGDKERICIFSEYAKDKILTYLDSRKDNFEYLFVSRENNRWSKKSIQDFIKSVGRECGIKKNVHPHILRHARAMSLLNNNVPLETISIVLGHSSVSTTQIYAHSDIQKVQSSIDKIDSKD